MSSGVNIAEFELPIRTVSVAASLAAIRIRRVTFPGSNLVGTVTLAPHGNRSKGSIATTKAVSPA